jgi:signal transduction histidine kinase
VGTIAAYDIEPLYGDPDLQRHAQGHLGHAERQISYLRMVGMVGWAVILLRDGLPESAAAGTYLAGLAYTVFAHARIRRRGPVHATAHITSVGDPLLVTAMCGVSGVLQAPFFPFYYFTVLAAVLRYGANRSVAILAFHAALVAAMHVALSPADQTLGDLLIAVFNLSFAAALGALLANWAQQNLDLAQQRSRQAQYLLQRLIRTQEQERRNLAGELHDRMSAHLFALRQAADQSADTPDLAATVDACSKDVRALMETLHPTVLDELGFCRALEEYVDSLADTGAPLIELRIDREARAWRSPDQTMLFRIAQEAVLNARKHARASRVQIAFARVSDTYVLTVSDDGTGIKASDPDSGHMGLLIMRERARALGAQLALVPGARAGTTLRVTLPVEDEKPCVSI